MDSIFQSLVTGLVASPLIALAIGVGACAPMQRADGGIGLLPVGAAAPEVAGADNDNHVVRLSAVRGRPAVVYFYPKDATPGCTKEACAFRDAFDSYTARHVSIFAVSRDGEATHREFRATHHLPFPLVADEDGAIANAYGVESTLGMTARVTFLINAEGRVARVWRDVDPGVHASEVLKAVDALPAPVAATPR